MNDEQKPTVAEDVTGAEVIAIKFPGTYQAKDSAAVEWEFCAQVVPTRGADELVGFRAPKGWEQVPESYVPGEMLAEAKIALALKVLRVPALIVIWRRRVPVTPPPCPL